MINLTKEEFNQLNYISFGCFGKTYRLHNILFKQYHDFVKTNYHTLVNNPCLKRSKYKFQLMKHRNEQLRYSDLIIDTFSIENRFAGVCYPYYDGKTMFEKKETISFYQKKKILLELIRNAKELTNYKIYPQDYKLNNIMIVGKELQVKIIDLDDILTKYTYFPNKKYYQNSLYALKQTVKEFFNEYYINQNFNPYLSRYRENQSFYQNDFPQYQDILDYIKWHDQNSNFLFIHINEINHDSISTIKNLLHLYQIRIVILIPLTQLFSNTSQEKLIFLSKNNIPIFDIMEIKNNDLNSQYSAYLNNYSCHQIFEWKNNQLYRIEGQDKNFVKIYHK